MYATMIACAFASCSNDDVPTPDNGNPDAQGGTSLTVKFDKAADTKASGDITSLSMLVFNVDGKLEVVGTKVNTPAVEGGRGGFDCQLYSTNKFDRRNKRGGFYCFK